MGCKENYPKLVREAGFKLRQYRDGPLDWRLMGSYETERILREQNFEMIDNALQHLSEAPLGTVLESNILDSGIAKYFVMSQYAIQYLIYCRSYLDDNAGELREAHATGQQEIAKLRKSLAESNNEIVQLHKRITQIEAIREVVYPCHLCTKNFISNEALNIHIGRRHGGGRAPAETTGGGTGRDKDNDQQLINTIKMELEIKQLKERLNAAERNIKERSSGASSSRKHMSTSPRAQQQEATVRTVGIQSNLTESKEKDELSSEAVDSENSERKEQLHGLAERISSFEAWQAQLKQSNEQFIVDINQKLEQLTNALEQTKQRAEVKAAAAIATTATPGEERVATPCLEDLERILTEKVTEIGKVSASKLEEVVYHLEMGYKDKLEALERELKLLNVRKEPTPVQPTASKIPKPLSTAPRKDETNLERIKREVESAFLKKTRDDDTYSIEEELKLTEQQQPSQIKKVQEVLEVPTGGSSGSQQTYTKPAAVELPAKAQLKAISSPVAAPETTDISESLSEEDESASEEGSELLTSEPEREIYKASPSASTKSKAKTPQKPPQPVTRRDVRKLINRRLQPHGFDMKSKSISQVSLKRATVELSEHRNKLKLQYPHFYATRNRIRKFVEKLCSAKLPERAEVLLNHKRPLQPIEVPKRPSQRQSLPVTTDDEAEETIDDDATSEQSHSSSPEQQQQRDFKAHLEQILVKPAARAPSSLAKPARTVVQVHQADAKPVPLPRKRVMFNTLGSGKSGKTFDESDAEK